MDYYLGEIELLPYGFAPMYFLPCDGRILPIAPNTALYSLIGTRFGGDAKTTFALPNLSDVSPVSGTAYYICVAGMYPARD